MNTIYMHVTPTAAIHWRRDFPIKKNPQKTKNKQTKKTQKTISKCFFFSPLHWLFHPHFTPSLRHAQAPRSVLQSSRRPRMP